MQIVKKRGDIRKLKNYEISPGGYSCVDAKRERIRYMLNLARKAYGLPLLTADCPDYK